LTADDYNLDGRPEVRIANDRLLALLAPGEGGQLYQLDVKSICHNLQATLGRREEAYHRKVRSGPSDGGGDVASIHDRVVFKQEGLDQRLQYDSWRRNSLVDHFFATDVQLDDVAESRVVDLGDFVHGAYESTLRRSEGRVQLLLHREGSVGDRRFKLTKGVTLNQGESVLEIAYLLENIPGDLSLLLAPEFNLAGLPSGADDRFFHDEHGTNFGQLGTRLNLDGSRCLGLTDRWLGIDVRFEFDRPTSVWTYPVETVSQSEGGFEAVHQCVAVVPHWLVAPDANGRWSVTFRVAVDTQEAESRMGEFAEAASRS
ncbi:MAG: DUF1926 domain-containing protein, partial [Planctomycetales bacterium]|nr:DUF1926 domain-containing protein [Planctomycetales bacterium]